MRITSLLLASLSTLTISQLAHAGSQFKDTFRLRSGAKDIRIASCRGNSAVVKKMKIKAVAGDYFFRSARVHFSNGQSHHVNLRKALRRGQSSNWISLQTSKGCIKKISLSYASEANNNKFSRVYITLAGRHDNRRGHREKRLATHNFMYGQQGMNPIHYMAVNNCAQGKGKVSKVRYQVRGGNAVLKPIIIHFADGSRQGFTPKKGFHRNGEQSDWISLKGKARCVSELSYTGHSTNGAFLELIGK